MRRIVLVDIGGASASGMIVSSPVDPPFSSPIDDSPTIDNSPTIDGSPIHDSLLDYLISWWDHDETGDATVTRTDSHGTNDFNSNSNVSHTASGLIGNGTFHGVAGGYLSRASGSVTDLGLVTGDFTLASWFLSSDTNNNTGLLSRWDDPGDNRRWTMYLQAGEPKFSISTDGTGGTQLDLASGVTPAANDYHLVVVWRDTAADLLYIQVDNGTPVSTALDGSTPLHNGAADLFSMSIRNGLYGSALTADIQAAWSRMLTTDERTHFYNSGAGLQYSDLIV